MLLTASLSSCPVVTRVSLRPQAYGCAKEDVDEPSDVLLWSLCGLRTATATVDRNVSEGESLCPVLLCDSLLCGSPLKLLG